MTYGKNSRSFLLTCLVITLTALTAIPAAAKPQMRVLTYNVYGIFIAPDRDQRIQAIPQNIAELDPDIIAFQEVFKQSHRDTLIEGMRLAGYPFSGIHHTQWLYGTGILLITKYEILAHQHHNFRVKGVLLDPERYAGKGVEHFLLKTPSGNIDLYLTHPTARFKPLYNQDGQMLLRDHRTVDRILQMEQIHRIIQDTRNPDGKAVIAAGDFNASPEMISYQYLKARSGLINAFEQVNPDTYASTYSPANTYVGKDWSMIDNIFHKNYPGSNGPWLKPVRAEVTLTGTIQLDPKTQVSLSDHYGMLADYQIVRNINPEPDTPEKKACTKIGHQDTIERMIILDPSNQQAWREWAFQAIDQALKSKNRFDKRVVPAARIIAHPPVEKPVYLEMTQAESLAVELDLKTFYNKR